MPTQAIARPRNPAFNRPIPGAALHGLKGSRITAVEPIPPGADNFATAPVRFNNIYAYASVLTGTLSP